ncbi:tRNA (guanosine(46)-N7)-methyltransferase TrmB [Lachnotalea sp. AF33-28]|uniref:tRNA (guanosine(46)-N7)-methyltransferase TrmB n=1 Tax=Lachnotalea sp. AF33-28 TaxID=2292046 RepID=UPI000E4E535D|nr:tRNA (guanosine(46)-N7)-methyltransferase TrmB [Lachnotalea sp. AF33-28]RHP30736.1 tRNA (guanosine(46)-N7)-methyltransferase TrmB [Lachnotalea sp. AF33-28]
MRLRNIPGAREAIKESPYTVTSPQEWRGKWNEFYKNTAPLHIEIGMGKGKFLTELALAHRDIHYIGIEKYSSVLIRALEKKDENDTPNLYFLRLDAEDITDVFSENEVSRIYLNFSDPWPKDRHAKRRLTSPQFFERYRHILMPEGQVEFKTDNRELFEFSLRSVTEAGWELAEYTFDLHHSGMNAGNIMTEYEERFSAMGNPICKLIARPVLL